MVLLYNLTLLLFCFGLIILIYLVFSACYSTNKNCKYKGSFKEWETNLEPWTELIQQYNTNILDIVKNKKQNDIIAYECYSNKNNNSDYMMIDNFFECNDITIRDSYHLKTCCNIQAVMFFIRNDESSFYSYIIRRNKFYKKIISNFAYYHCVAYDNPTDSNAKYFTSSKELFLDFEKQKILELFS
jgi:hypothetical protein